MLMLTPWSRRVFNFQFRLHRLETAFSKYYSVLFATKAHRVERAADSVLTPKYRCKQPIRNWTSFIFTFSLKDCCPKISKNDIHSRRISETLTRMDKQSSASCPASHHIRSDAQCKGKWIGLSEITYKDPLGRERKWEAVFRTTKVGDGSDAVIIIPIVKQKNKGDSVILVSQYRPPLKHYSLEFPAGLIDKGEDPEVCAMRELKEETGYTGVATHMSPGVSLDPGLANSTVNVVTVEIDGDQDCNKDPEQQQDEGEFIEVLSAPMDALMSTLDQYTKERGVVHSVVYSYAMALSYMAKSKKDAP